MEFVRTVINSDILESIIIVPESLKRQKVEVLILPVNDVNEVMQNQKLKSLKGALKEYKNTDLIKEESSAWSKAMVEKHDNS